MIAGATLAVARGAVFTILLLWIKFLGRPVASGRLILICACLMAVFWPLGLIYSLSWQLSFLAFLGIMYIPPILFLLWPKLSSSFLTRTFVETVSAQISVLPLITYTFGTISLVSPLTNIAVLSLTPLAMLVAALQAGVSLISLTIGHITVWLAYPILSLIISIIEFSSQIPFASIAVGRFSLVWCLVTYTFLLAAWLIIWYRKGKNYVTTN